MVNFCERPTVNPGKSSVRNVSVDLPLVRMLSAPFLAAGFFRAGFFAADFFAVADFLAVFFFFMFQGFLCRILLWLGPGSQARFARQQGMERPGKGFHRQAL